VIKKVPEQKKYNTGNQRKILRTNKQGRIVSEYTVNFQKLMVYC
jgi:hypothetical protein